MLCAVINLHGSAAGSRITRWRATRISERFLFSFHFIHWGYLLEWLQFGSKKYLEHFWQRTVKNSLWISLVTPYLDLNLSNLLEALTIQGPCSSFPTEKEAAWFFCGQAVKSLWQNLTHLAQDGWSPTNSEAASG